MPADNNKSHISRDVLAYIPVKIVPAVTGLLSIIILTKNLAPEEYGRYSVVITTVLLLVQLSGTWLSNSVLYFFPEQKTPESKYIFWRQTINLQLILAIPATGLTFLAINVITNTPMLALAGSALVLFQLTQALMLTFFQSSRKIRYQGIIVSAQSMLQMLTLCWLVFFENGKELSVIVSVIVGSAVGNIVAVLGSREIVIKAQREIPVVSSDLFIRLAKYGMPMCLWFFATQFYMIGDRILLQYFEITEQLGQYASFRDLATGCAGFLTMPLLMASHPIIMEKWKNKHPIHEIEEIISRNIIILSLLFIPLITATHIIGDDVVTAMFGERYALPANIMVLVVFSIFSGSIAMHLQRGLEATENTLLMAKLALITAVFFALFGIAAIPKFGVMASAAAVALSSCLYILLILFNTRSILLPRISAAFWIRLMTWMMLVKCSTLFVTIYWTGRFQHSTIFYINASILIIATISLYLTSHRIWGATLIQAKEISKK